MASNCTNGSLPNGTSCVDSATSDGMPSFYFGIVLAASSSLFIGSSFILKKKALIRLANGAGDSAPLTSNSTPLRAGSGGYGYLRDWLWWAGVLTMGAGEACNLVALGMAPATLVTPLGALSVLVTTILSSRFLNERLNLLGKLGCAVCILGSTVLVIHSPKEEGVATMLDLGRKMQDVGFIIYVAIVLSLAVFLAVHVAPRHGQTNLCVFIGICSLIGSLSVLGCKGIGLAVKETIQGNNQIWNPLTWFWLVCVVVCVSIQLNYLNKALDIFNTAMVTPVYYVLFTSCVILASGILYNEWSALRPEDILGLACGFATTVIGIFQMQLFREAHVSLPQLRAAFGRRVRASSVLMDVGSDFNQEPDGDRKGLNEGGEMQLDRYEPLSGSDNANVSRRGNGGSPGAGGTRDSLLRGHNRAPSGGRLYDASLSLLPELPVHHSQHTKIKSAAGQTPG